MPHSNARNPKRRPLPPPPGYAPRNPRNTALYQAIQQNRYAAFNALADTCLPAYVERHFDAYLRCGILGGIPEYCGFLRLRCDECCQDLLVPFSCKKRGVCPSCSARRASDTAVHLTDHVLPQIPYRQWVFTLPYRLRHLLSRNPRLLTRILKACIRALFVMARKRAKAAGLNARHPSAITFIQRFGSALQLNVHFHVVMPDGLFDDDGKFQYLPSLHDEDVEHVLSKTIRNIVRTCGESILGGDETEPSALSLLDGRALVPLSLSPRPYPPLNTNPSLRANKDLPSTQPQEWPPATHADSFDSAPTAPEGPWPAPDCRGCRAEPSLFL